MGEHAMLSPKAAHAVVQIRDSGSPWLRGYRCGHCHAVVLEETLCCRACGVRDAPSAVSLSEGGQLFTWAVVHRSFPGVVTPFVSAIVDLDDGLTLKGTLRCSEPGALHAGQAVEIVFDDAGGAKDAEGAPYIGFHFELAAGDEA